MAKRINPKNIIPVVKHSHTKAFIASLNKTVPTEQERLAWQKLSASFSSQPVSSLSHK